MNQRLVLITKFLCMLMLIFVCGCTKLTSELPYNPPELPESELATIQIDTEKKWVQHASLIIFRVNGKVALREEIKGNSSILKGDSSISVADTLVGPGNHDMSVHILIKNFSEGRETHHRIVSKFSAKLKTGGTYLLRGDVEPDVNNEASYTMTDAFDLIDTATDTRVSISKFPW